MKIVNSEINFDLKFLSFIFSKNSLVGDWILRSRFSLANEEQRLRLRQWARRIFGPPSEPSFLKNNLVNLALVAPQWAITRKIGTALLNYSVDLKKKILIFIQLWKYYFKGPVQKNFKKKSKKYPAWFCSELSGDSKTVSGLPVRPLISSQWSFKVDGGSTLILNCCARLERLTTL